MRHSASLVTLEFICGVVREYGWEVVDKVRATRQGYNISLKGRKLHIFRDYTPDIKAIYLNYSQVQLLI